MRTQPMSMGTSGTATEYSTGQILTVTLAFAAVVGAGLVALSYPTVAAAFLAGGATAWVATVGLRRLRSARRSERAARTTRTGATDESY